MRSGNNSRRGSEMTTHMKAPSGIGFLTLCRNFEPECALTDDISKVDCRECREVLNSNSQIDTHYVKPWYDTASATQVGGDHYTVLDVQPWDAMANWMSPCEFEGFLRGNAIKYLARAGAKGDALEDFRKARHYLDKLIEVLESGS